MIKTMIKTSLLVLSLAFCLNVAHAESIYLSDMDISLMPTGWGKAQKNKNIDGGVLALGHKHYANGIGLHANSRITIYTGGAANHFHAVVGVDASQKEKGSVVFQVRGDGRKLYISDIKHGSSEPSVIDLNISGIRKLELISNDGGDNINNDWADWCDASIQYRGMRPRVINANEAYEPEALYPALKDCRKSPGHTKFYVNANNGSDKNSGSAPGTAWKTFAPLNAIRFAPGDTIYIAPGKYDITLKPHAFGSKKHPVRIIFTKGRYDFFPNRLLTRKYHISNNNDQPYKPKAIAIMLEKAENLQLLSRDALFFMRGKMIEVCIDHSENITLYGLKFDYKRPTVSEFSVINVSNDYADLRIHPDSTYEIRNGRLYWIGEGWEHPVQGYGQAHDIAANTTRRCHCPLAGLRTEQLPEADTIRAYFKNNKNPGFRKGIIYQNRKTTRDCVGVFQLRSKNILWKNCAFYFMHGLGVVSQYSEKISFVDVDITPRPGSRRTISAWGDMLHFSGCRGQITIKNVHFNGSNDDAINIHGIHLRIMERISDRKIKLRFMHGQTYGIQAFQPGDTVDFIRISTMTPYASNKVIAVERPDDHTRILTLEKDVPLDIGKLDAIENATWTADALISGCRVENIPTRGFLLTTRGKVVVQNNTFIKTGMPPILIEDDARGWFESGFVRDMTITNNVFMDCAEPSIRVSPSVTSKAKPTHKNIRVLNNKFYLKYGRSIIGCLNTQGLTIKGNKIYLAKNRIGKRDIKSFIRLNAVRDVTIENNQILERK